MIVQRLVTLFCSFLRWLKKNERLKFDFLIWSLQELQQGNGNLGTTGLSGMQDSPHSLKIKQEPFQLSPPSPLPPLQGMYPLHHYISVTRVFASCKHKYLKTLRERKSLHLFIGTSFQSKATKKNVLIDYTLELTWII